MISHGRSMSTSNTVHLTYTRRYSSSEAHFSSDFISTLGIVQGHIMREATAAKARVESAFGPSAASLAHGVSLVWPKLQAQRELQKLYHQLEGLQVGWHTMAWGGRGRARAGRALRFFGGSFECLQVVTLGVGSCVPV